MEPQIRYCTTPDGARIAYTTNGAGPPLLCTASFLPFAWRREDARRRLLDGRLEQHFALTHYDGRGWGLSDRNATDYSLEARVADLLSVADAVGAQTFCLWGELYGVPTAIATAARHPRRVERLVLWGGYAVGARYYEDTDFGRVADALQDLTTEQWQFVSEAVMARGALPGTPPDVIRRLGEVVREAWEPETMLAFRAANRAMDVTSDLARIAAPTLVVHANQKPELMPHAQELAAGIPHARFLKATTTWDSVAEDAIDHILQFMGAAASPRGITPAPIAGGTPSSATSIILFADIADSTGLTERLGDGAFRDHARTLDDALRKAITANGGTPIEGKLLGDGVLATFSAASQAIAAARACAAACDGTPLQLHLGIHAGDVIREANNVFGGAVNIAARISAMSAAGEILFSGTVRDLARTSAGVGFEDRGEQALKGIAEAVRVYAVR